MENKVDIISYAIIWIFVLFLVVHAHFGVDFTDESFYMSLAHRLWLGDKPIVHEWNTAQLSGALVLPFYSIYRSLFGTADDVYLVGRIVMVLLMGIGAAITYTALRKEVCWLSCISSALVFLLYARCNIKGPSYYNMYLFYAWMGVILLYWAITNENECEKKKKVIFSGTLSGGCFIAAVLCVPQFVIAEIVLATVVIWKHREKNVITIISVITGAVALTMWYFLFVFSHDIKAITEAIPYMQLDVLNSEKFGRYMVYGFKGVFDIDRLGVLFSLKIVVGGIIIKSISDDLYYQYMRLTGVLSIIVIMLYQAISIRRGDEPGYNCYIIMAFSFYVILYHLSERNGFTLGVAAILAGWVMSICFGLASNTYQSAMSTGAVIAAIGVLSIGGNMVAQLYSVYSNEKRWLIYIGGVLLTMLLISTSVYARICCVYRDEPLNMLNEKVNKGPMRGLYTTKTKKEEYDSVMEAIEFANSLDIENGYIIFEPIFCAGYLDSDYGYGTYSCWRNIVEEDSDRLKNYYSVYPERQADVIIMLKDFDYTTEFYNDLTVRDNSNQRGYLWEIIKRDNYQYKEFEKALCYYKSDI